MTDAEAFKKVFLDTAPLIYFLDNDPQFGLKMKEILESFLSENVQILSSVITCEEYLIIPYRTANQEKIEVFFDFTRDCGIELVPVDTIIAQKAAEIRAHYQHFKSMDALQLAVAVTRGCDAFLTNDKQLKQFSDLPCILVEEW